MPCRDDYPPGYDEGYKSGASTVALFRKRNNELAKLLCQACKVLDIRSEIQRYNLTELEAWWLKHQKFDRKEGC